MSGPWHYVAGGVQQGPISTADLQALVRSCQLSRTDLVWSAGMPAWTAVAEIAELASAIPTPPPPFPPAISASIPTPAFPPLPAPLAASNPSLGPALFNPLAAIAWSVLLTPVFGAWLQAKNWQALGDHAKATQSLNWMSGSIALFVVAIFLPPLAAGGIALGLLLLWAILSGREQVVHIQQRFQQRYLRRDWSKPVLSAVVGVAGYALIAGYNMVVLPAGAISAQMLVDVSGVWQANGDKAAVILRLAEDQKSVQINDKTFPVKVADLDADTHIVKLSVGDTMQMVWTIQQVFKSDTEFTLELTLHDGTHDGLSYVRDL